MTEVDQKVLEGFTRLVAGCRDQCLWFLREDYCPTDPEGMRRVLQHIRRHGDRDVLLAAHRMLEYAEPTPAGWLGLGDLAAKLRRTGTTVPFSDLLIASIAIEHRLEVITADRHFSLIPGVRVQAGGMLE